MKKKHFPISIPFKIRPIPQTDGGYGKPAQQKRRAVFVSTQHEAVFKLLKKQTQNVKQRGSSVLSCGQTHFLICVLFCFILFWFFFGLFLLQLKLSTSSACALLSMFFLLCSCAVFVNLVRSAALLSIFSQDDCLTCQCTFALHLLFCFQEIICHSDLVNIYLSSDCLCLFLSY